MSGNKHKSEKLQSGELLEKSRPEENNDVENDETLVPLEQTVPDVSGAQGASDEEQTGDTEDPARALEEQKRVAAANLEKALRAQAELENLRKRTARDIENAHKYALEKFIAELLPVMDSMELGLSAAAENTDDIASLKEGMELTHKMLAAALEKSGIRVIDPLGEKFDPARHEAISMLEQEGIASGHVISVMQKGYELNGRLVRPAMVVVAK